MGIINLSVLLGFLATYSLIGQTDSSVVGRVSTKGGKPIAGVKVYSSTCCPRKDDEATTDQNGRFRLRHPGAVIHVLKDKLQPKTYILGSTKTEIHITLESSTGDLTVPVCTNAEPDQQRIGWGRYGLQFSVVKGAVQILGGKPDVDYVRYVIKPKSGESHLELWFGLNAISAMPDDAEFVKSESFAQRSVIGSDGKLRGFDSWGQRRGGGSWRYTSVLGEGGSIYEKASRKEATLFDQIVNSICEIPYSSQR